MIGILFILWNYSTAKWPDYEAWFPAVVYTDTTNYEKELVAHFKLKELEIPLAQRKRELELESHSL